MNEKCYLNAIKRLSKQAKEPFVVILSFVVIIDICLTVNLLVGILQQNNKFDEKNLGKIAKPIT